MKTEVQQLKPALRFPEFEGEWVETKLGNISTFSKGKGVSKKDIEAKGKNECIRYGELYTKYREVIEVIVSKTNIEISESILSEKNDVIIPSSGETQLDIATASCVLKNGVILGGDLNIIRSNVNGVFLSYLLNNNRKKEIARLAQGNSVVHLYNKQLATLKINLPKSNEQQKIASFLTTIDSRIQALEKKKSSLEQYKKGVMQKIFTQEIRFKDEDGKDFPEWEEKKLGEVALTPEYGMNSAAKKFDGKHKYLRITDIDEITQTFKPNPLTSPSGGIDEKYLLREGDLVFARTGASVGKSYLYNPKDGELYFAGFLIRFRINNALPKYIFYQTQSYYYRKWVSVYSMRSGQPGINANEYKSITIPLPSLAEQTHITNFLTAIDKKIALVNEQIEKTKAYKKGLLQKMFV